VVGALVRSEHSATTGPASVTLVPDSSRRAASWLVAGVAATAVCAAVGVWWVARAPTSGPQPTSTASAEPAPVKIPEAWLASFGTLPTEIGSPANELTEAKIDLGRMLYYDPRLSRGQDVACQTCHPLDKWGSDGRRVSEGHRGQQGRRNALSVYHAAGAFALMWDGRSPTIEAQASLPLFEPTEMATVEGDVVRLVQSIPGYQTAFTAAFPDSRPAVTMINIGNALGAFERKLVTPSRWDAFLGGKTTALDDKEKAGFNAFVEVGCPTCHVGAYVGLTMFQKLGLMKTWPSVVDRGRFEVTKQDADAMFFRVPSLRNIDRTGPYFHDGSVAALPEAVRMMALHQLGKELGDAQVEDIVAWLRTLTGDIPQKLIERPPLLPSGPSTPKPVK
jgi:cytochrome c peroxidase